MQHGARLQKNSGVHEGKSHSGHENDPWGTNFSAMELYALIHALAQQRMANQTRGPTGPVRDDDKRPFSFKFEPHAVLLLFYSAENRRLHRLIVIKIPITF